MKAKRTTEGLKKHFEASKLTKRRKRLDPEFRAKEAAKAKERYDANKEKYRLATLRTWAKNKERYNERKKKWRRDNPAAAHAADRRNYGNSIKATIAKYRRGDIGLDILIERLRKTFVRFDDRLETFRNK